MPPMMVQGRLLHNLLMREVCSLDDDALHFVVSGAKLHFGLGEFALITGLKCKSGKSITIKSVPNRLVKKYFKSTSNVTWSQASKANMSLSRRGNVESSNVDMKKELESFRVHVDSKFAEILQAIKYAFTYSGGLHTDCVDLDVNGNQGIHGGDGNVKDVKSDDGVCGGDSSKEDVGGGVGDRLGGGEGNDSQSDFAFVLVSESTIVAITQKYYIDKNGENDKVPDMNVNTQNLLDDEFFKYLSESVIATIIQDAKVGVASTEVVGDEQSIKDDFPENTTINAVVTEQVREDVLPQRGYVESADAGNESVDGGLVK
ncbi:hypothetical protein RND71_019614 [Anisodus tanguticus]|uniref:DUF1985 domain-containing protein n=1 Tax=Anisodus tanguticus TaxID=243964 RepID=A0AAE1S0U8_9SOLA|nr:hypothetical protein RND71_019614 [Anisodus tanguticus]